MRQVNIIVSVTLAALTFPDWMCLFFVVCALVAWSEKPAKSSTENGKGSVC